MVACPVGKRVLVVASRGVTSAYNKGGSLVNQFQSPLPGGSSGSRGKLASLIQYLGYTILDCLLTTQTLYCVDVLCWNEVPQTESPFSFRRFFINSRLEDNPQFAKASKRFRYRFLSLPACLCAQVCPIFSEVSTERYGTIYETDV